MQILWAVAENEGFTQFRLSATKEAPPASRAGAGIGLQVAVPSVDDPPIVKVCRLPLPGPRVSKMAHSKLQSRYSTSILVDIGSLKQLNLFVLCPDLCAMAQGPLHLRRRDLCHPGTEFSIPDGRSREIQACCVHGTNKASVSTSSPL